MNYDSFLSTPRWEILQILAESPASPIEIAKKLNTTVSYSSQQLTLLNAAGIVVKNRTGAFEKGKPRNLYSLSKEIGYLTCLISGFSSKKLLDLNNEHKAILKFWAYYPEESHNILQKMFWGLSDFKEDYQILINKDSKELVLVSDIKKIKENFLLSFKNNKKEIKFKAISMDDFFRLKKEDIDLVYSNVIEMKGGEKK